LAVMLEQVIS